MTQISTTTKRRCIAGLLALMAALPGAHAGDTKAAHEATITLLDPQGKPTIIGKVSFSGWKNGSTGFAVEIESSTFSDHFLSMRPFRCLQGKGEWFCYLPYPYPIKNVITKDDLTDLSYALLFIRKTPSEFGIDAWNGLYYQLVRETDGSISGQLLEGDLNVLASPPAEKFSRPINLDDFIEASKTKRLFPRLVIK